MVGHHAKYCVALATTGGAYIEIDDMKNLWALGATPLEGRGGFDPYKHPLRLTCYEC